MSMMNEHGSYIKVWMNESCINSTCNTIANFYQNKPLILIIIIFFFVTKYKLITLPNLSSKTPR